MAFLNTKGETTMSLNYREPIDTSMLFDDMRKHITSPSKCVSIFGETDREAILDELTNNPPEHLEVTLRYIAETTLHENAQKIFYMRYCGHKLVYREIGAELGITHERVRQILTKFQYKLGTPYYLICMRDGIEAANVQVGKCRGYNAAYTEGYHVGYKKGFENAREGATESGDLMNTPIAAMAELTNRSSNALHRAGFRTLRDIVDNQENIPNLNCIGVGSVQNIIATLSHYNIDCVRLRNAALQAYSASQFLGAEEV